MLSGHETADFSSIQIAALIITDHNRANYYLAEFLVKHITHVNLSRLILILKKAEKSKKSHGAVCEGTY